ncbi:MAG: hypothetical protein LBL13_08840 [Bacteroidales bacterium]|jgi:hypothetical protein|nr:hypothetical protein [Bacteroidales bacterium]
MNRILILINQKIDYTKCIAISGHDTCSLYLVPCSMFLISMQMTQINANKKRAKETRGTKRMKVTSKNLSNCPIVHSSTKKVIN